MRLGAPSAARRLGQAFLGALAVSAAFFTAASAVAQGLVEYEFAGFVSDNSGNLGVFGSFGSVGLNDPISGRFSYMAGPSNPDQEPTDPELGVYNLVDFQIDQAVVTITPLAIGVTHRPGLPTLDPLPPDPGVDRFSVVGSFQLGDEQKIVSLILAAPYQAVFSDDSLPTSLSLTDFTDATVVQSIRLLALEPDGMSQIDLGQLTSLTLVPEPSAFVLAVVCLALAPRVPRRD